MHAGEVTHGAVSLELRALGGRVVVPSRQLAVGDEISFRDQGATYAIRVERLYDVFSFIVFTSKDAVELRVIARDGDSDAPEAGGDEALDERGQAPVPMTLAELIRSHVADADAAVALAQNLAAEGRVAESRAALDAARRRQAEARNGLRSIVGLFREWNYWRVGDLSIVEARIARALPIHDVPPGTGAFHVVGELAMKASGRQRLEAEILEARTVGKRYDNRTEMGKRYPSQRRDDVIRGGTIVIENSRFETGEKLEPGRAYRLALTPPNAYKAIPRDAGKGEHTQVVFALPIAEK